MPRPVVKTHDDAMYKAILTLQSVEECRRFFEDLCAMTELNSIEQRFEVASMLHQNRVYTEIKEKTNASSATISRVNRMLNYGTGCIGEVLDRMQAMESESKEETE
ncbi:MAG: TrpR-like protein [Clostridiales bacterium]|nr:TrpR-like protein [Clostridiales bacterium]